MKRILNYEAVIAVPMDLHKFPFDIQKLTPEFVSISHWMQYDETRASSLPHGQSYALRPVSRPDASVVTPSGHSDQVSDSGTPNPARA